MTDRSSVLLVDVENVIGPSKPRLAVVRSRVQALLAAAGPLHHAVACYSPEWPTHDTVPSALIELGVVPWPVAAGRHAAETTLCAHARYLATRGTRWRFVTASGDHRLAQLAEYGELHVLIWDDQPLASKLESAAVAVHRLPKPHSASPHPGPALDLAGSNAAGAPSPPVVPARARTLSGQVATALLTGIGIAFGHRLADTVRARRGT